MTEVISIKFKTGGKDYYFSPEGLEIHAGDKVIVETAKGLEMADCSRGNRWVEDTSVVQPLRPVIRLATAQDLRTIELNHEKEKDAFRICQKKIADHKLDMKLVSVEWSFDGSKTLFFFTSDGRVDFRELVKDLASVFHNRIELRQIGVRDEAKMTGGIGICGRPFCCSEFLDDFAPVSTKMAKIQNLSLNPAKISGSCGRLMCCLRYEEDAYEELYKNVPKQGAFVETVDGYGVAVQIGLLRQTVKVHLDGEAEDAYHYYKAAQVAAVPGGRPRDGEPLPKVLNYVASEEEDSPEDEEDPWASPVLFAEPVSADAPAEPKARSAENTWQRSEETSWQHTDETARQHTDDRRPTRPDDRRPSRPDDRRPPRRKPAPAKEDALSRSADGTSRPEGHAPAAGKSERPPRPPKGGNGPKETGEPRGDRSAAPENGGSRENRFRNRRRKPPMPKGSGEGASAPQESPSRGKQDPSAAKQDPSTAPGAPAASGAPRAPRQNRPRPAKQNFKNGAEGNPASAGAEAPAAAGTTGGEGAPKKKYNNHRRHYGRKPGSGGNPNGNSGGGPAAG